MKNPPLLLQILQNKILPWVQQDGIKNLVVAYPTLKQMYQQELPDGISLSPRPLKSKWVKVRGKKLFRSDAAEVDSYWAEDGMYARRVPGLAIITQGHVALPYGDYWLHAHAGHMILMPPGTPHSDGSHLGLDESVLNKGTRQSVNFMVRGNGVECWMKQVKDYHDVPVESGNYYLSSLLPRQCLEVLLEESVKKQAYSADLAILMLQALIAQTSRAVVLGRLSSSADNDVERSAISGEINGDIQMVVRAKEYLQNHLHEELTIDKVSGAMYVSRAYFTRKFRQHTGKSFIEYVNNCRLNEAKVLLEETEWPVTKIGQKVGLRPSRLREVFQENEGMSPVEFRKRLHST
jgi:AraC-like DNA-binding protein